MRLRVAIALALVSCSSPGAPRPAPVVVAPPPPPATPVAPPAAPTPPALRLPTGVRPTANTVELTIDPASEDFTGSISTSIAVDEPTSVIWLNGDELELATATATVGGVAQKATITAPKKGYLALSFAAPLARGTGTLAITYRGKMHRSDGDGIYTAQEGGDWYAYTQFEATDARQAFPTFDEPSFKVPWKLTLHTKQALVALSNTPVVAERPEPNGMKAVEFAETKPLPAYLVAFTVGPYDLVDAGKTKSGVPVRIVVPRGRSADAGYAAKVTVELLERVEQYFGTPYPYPKLDLVAFAVFNAGAMENPGLITYRQNILLTKPEERTLGREQRFATVTAHEIAHQWFGDYVTLAWWDDTWLNESFASWMETKIIEAWQPTWDLDIDAVSSKSGVMGRDSLDSARAIRQPITTAEDIDSSFDGITYGKGEAVLAMIERSVGPDVFQRGVRAYLAKHAWGNATYDDFVGAMTEAAGKDLRPLFEAFVKQSGVPVVEVRLQCAKGEPAKLALSQRRYAPTGSKIDPNRTWTIPVCVRWGAGAKTGRDCFELSTPAAELALSAPSCPDWVVPNEGSHGYYRAQLEPALLTKLLGRARKVLGIGERIGLIGDVDALVESGVVGKGVALALVADLAKDPSRHIVDASMGIVAGIDEMVGEQLRPNYERFIRKLYLARAKQLGWQSKPGEGPDAKELRPELLSLVAGDGKDPALVAEATKLAWKWLDDRKAVDPTVVGAVLGVAARYGDQALYDRLHAEAKKVTDRTERGRILSALGGFSDPKIVVQALALILTDEFDLREAGGLSRGAMQDPRTRMIAYAFVKEHFDEISAKLPPAYRTYMAYFAMPLCDDKYKPELEAFLKPRIEKLDGGPRTLAQAMEGLSLCAAGRKAQAPAVEAFLKKQ
ncbi:MAG: M1 family metallopeptidase [Myxococcales bacterium]|nr:M1 family metallopeptidase [Myxococcales bacterium]